MIFGQDPSYFAARGATATAREIAQQGDCWQKIPALLAATDPALKSRLHAALHDARATIAFSGAGTSAYVGDILAPAIQRHSRAHCLTTASTDLVTQPAGKLPRDAHGFLFAFARSGNSPESVASLEKAAAVAPWLANQWGSLPNSMMGSVVIFMGTSRVGRVGAKRATQLQCGLVEG